MWLFAPLGSLLVLPVLIEAKSLIDGADRIRAGTLAGLIALGAWTVAAAAPATSADRQQRFVIEHVTDASAHKNWWSVLNDGAPLPRAFGDSWKRGKLPLGDGRRWIARAPADPTARAPTVQVVSQVRNGTERTVTVRLAANGNERVELAAPADSRLRAAGLPGAVRPIDGDHGQFHIDCFGRSCDGFTLQLVIGKLAPVDFLTIGGRAPLPPSAAPLLAARPQFAQPQYNRDESIAFSRIKL
jgi:hypothetical protein